MTTSGPVTGRRVDAVDSYLGLPYAAAPFGPHRFRAPAPPAPWTAPRAGVSFGPTAPQKAYANQGGLPDVPEPIIAGEEILTVNVWTPVDRPAPRPVLVWIHGGGFTAGCSANPWYDGTAFARTGLVVVSLNYRLGIEGMLELPGADPNRALRDWIAALRWVRDNAAAFGGDPGAVTVMGQSAGGMAVSALLVSPAARGLFHRAIIASGITANAVQSPQQAARTAQRLAAVLGRPATRDELAQVPPELLVAAQDTLAAETGLVEALRSADPDASMPWVPVLDGQWLATSPIEGVRAGQATGIPVLTGTTHDEFQWAGIRSVPGPSGRALGRTLADEFFRRPTQRFVDARARATAPTFRYEFQWESRADRELIGSGHSLDIPFFFNTLAAPYVAGYAGPNPPQPLADTMHGAFAAFARTGDPGWAPYHDDETVMVFDDECRVEKGFRVD